MAKKKLLYKVTLKYKRNKIYIITSTYLRCKSFTCVSIGLKNLTSKQITKKLIYHLGIIFLKRFKCLKLKFLFFHLQNLSLSEVQPVLDFFEKKKINIVSTPVDL